jgi:hypothetical protein
MKKLRKIIFILPFVIIALIVALFVALSILDSSAYAWRVLTCGLIPETSIVSKKGLSKPVGCHHHFRSGKVLSRSPSHFSMAEHRVQKTCVSLSNAQTPRRSW